MHKIKPHIEWIAFLSGLILMASMDPTVKGFSFCLFEQIGISFCPGEGLGHSIAWLFRGELNKSLNANLFGLLAVAVLSARILYIWKELLLNKTTTKTGYSDGRNL